MGQLFLYLLMAITIAAIIFGVTVLVSGSDPALVAAEPDGRAVPLPGNRPLLENDISDVRFDTGLRGYRMAQVDQALRRAAYDIGYKEELISVLEAEVAALREGRLEDADTLAKARQDALAPTGPDAQTAKIESNDNSGGTDTAEPPTVDITATTVDDPKSDEAPKPVDAPHVAGDPKAAGVKAAGDPKAVNDPKTDEPAAPDSTVKA